MIKYQDLIDNGFVEDGEWNGRDYFTKNGFNIVSHCGISRWNKNNPSGYGKQFETIEELNNAYREWAEKFIETYEPRLIAIKESLK